MPTKLPTFESAIEIAINDVRDCMIENIRADQAETESKERRKRSHYALQKANERLRNLQSDLYQDNLRNFDYDKDDKDYHANKDN